MEVRDVNDIWASHQFEVNFEYRISNRIDLGGLKCIVLNGGDVDVAVG